MLDKNCENCVFADNICTQKKASCRNFLHYNDVDEEKKPSCETCVATMESGYCQNKDSFRPCDQWKDANKATIRITELGLFCITLSTLGIIEDVIDDAARVNAAFELFQKRMVDNGYYCEADKEPKKTPENAPTPKEIFKTIMKVFFKTDEDTNDAAWDMWVMGMEEHGFLAN